MDTARDELRNVSGDVRRVVGDSIFLHEILHDTVVIPTRIYKVDVWPLTDGLAPGRTSELSCLVNLDVIRRQHGVRRKHELCLVGEQEQGFTVRNGMVEDGDLNVRCRGINRVGIQNVRHRLRVEVEELPRPREDDVFVRDESEPVSEEEDVIDSPPNEGRKGASVIVANHTLVPQTAFQRERAVRFTDQLHRHSGVIEQVGLRPAPRFLPHSRRGAVFRRVLDVIVGDDILAVTEDVQPDPVPTVRRKVCVLVNGVLHSLDAGLPVGVPHRKGEVGTARNLED